MSDLILTLQVQRMMTERVPIKVEIFGGSLRRLEAHWARAQGHLSFRLDAGIYGIRAFVPSGDFVEKSVELKVGESREVVLELGSLSPHEDHEWAYLTRSLGRQSSELLDETRYSGAWLRLWRKMADKWDTVPLSIDDASSSWKVDGVSYRIGTPGGLQFLQVGGAGVPSKFVALPGAQDLMVLVRPAFGPAEAVHPLDVIVSSDDWVAESMLSFLTAGAMDKANAMMRESYAEDLLSEKVRDPSSAAIGAYYLLRVGALERLHEWTQNLANWISWMPDGAVIRAWHVLKKARSKSRAVSVTREEARGRLLEAVSRGIPLYTEGLRLLKEGLVLLDQEARREDSDVRGALRRVEAYAAAADWIEPTTTFGGVSPEEPSPTPAMGDPSSRRHLAYIFDVPLTEMIRLGALAPGTEIRLRYPPGIAASISGEGRIRAGDRKFTSPSRAARALGSQSSDGWWDWVIGNTQETLAQRALPFRRGQVGLT